MRITFLFILFCIAELTRARQFQIHNNLGGTVYVGILGNAGKPIPENGGFALGSHQQRNVNVPDDWAGRFWARTGCNFNGNSGHCQTGDCGDRLACNGNGGAPPATLVEITLRGANNQDYYDISLVDGFNVPASITPANRQGQNHHCTTANCPRDLNPGCPGNLQIRSGNAIIACKSSCLANRNDQNCCTGAFNNANACRGGESAQYFSSNCPNAYSYAYDDAAGTFTCDSGDYPYIITFG